MFSLIGPSLEIISDTEEWLTDDDIIKKEDDEKRKPKRNKLKVKGKALISKAGDIDKSNAKGKLTIKNDNDKSKDIKIKKEDSKDKEKEGDSLLDLLELEMRARAIRALIRKEEDIIPSANTSQTNNSEATNKDKDEALQNDAMAKEDCRKQLERIINSKQGGEDEDVVLVVQPTPVVELISSDSDGEGNEQTRVNKKSINNKRVLESEGGASSSNENTKNSQLLQNSKEKETQEVTASQNNTSTTVRSDLSARNETRTKMTERNVDLKNNILSISISADNVADKRKKSKRKLRAKSQLVSSTASTTQDSSKVKRIKNTENTEQSSDKRDENIEEQSKTSLTFGQRKTTAEEEDSEKETEESKAEKEKLADSDEIVDLDDYCDEESGE